MKKGEKRAEEELRFSQQRLEEAQRIIRPLREMHRENHIAPLIRELIRRDSGSKR